MKRCWSGSRLLRAPTFSGQAGKEPAKEPEKEQPEEWVGSQEHVVLVALSVMGDLSGCGLRPGLYFL